MPHTGKRSSYPKQSSLSNKLFFDNISARILKDGLKSRFWKENFTTCQILNWKKKTTRQILIWKFCNASIFGLKKKNNALEFELKIFRHVTFRKNVCLQKITSWFFLLRENDIFCIFRAFLKSMILNIKFHWVSDFELKKIQRVRFLNWFFTMRQILI